MHFRLEYRKESEELMQNAYSCRDNYIKELISEEKTKKSLGPKSPKGRKGKKKEK